MKTHRVTSIDVAGYAGVSQSTVSRVFNKDTAVIPKTAEKVLQAAKDLGYRPNVLARSLTTGKSHIIGFVVAYLDNPFYAESLQKLSQGLKEEGYHILLFTVDNQPKQVSTTIKKLLDYQVDAIVAASVSIDNNLTQMCRTINVPVVLFNRYQNDDDISSITSNSIAGGRSVAHHFADIGVKRPAYIAGWSGASTQRDREAGFFAGLQQRNLKLYARASGDFNPHKAKQAAKELFARKKKTAPIPDAVFVANDYMAFAVMDYLRFELKLNIPKDVVVAGYDDTPIASWQSYQLTSVRQSIDEMVIETISILLHIIKQPYSKAIKKIIDTPLIIRQSTKRT